MIYFVAESRVLDKLKGIYSYLRFGIHFVAEPRVLDK